MYGVSTDSSSGRMLPLSNLNQDARDDMDHETPLVIREIVPFNTGCFLRGPSVDRSKMLVVLMETSGNGFFLAHPPTVICVHMAVKQFVVRLAREADLRGVPPYGNRNRLQTRTLVLKAMGSVRLSWVGRKAGRQAGSRCKARQGVQGSERAHTGARERSALLLEQGECTDFCLSRREQATPRDRLILG